MGMGFPSEAGIFGSKTELTQSTHHIRSLWPTSSDKDISRCLLIWAWCSPPSTGQWYMETVAYVSCSFTTAERHYVQIEKEAVAVTWGCEKFSDCILGRNLQIMYSRSFLWSANFHNFRGWITSHEILHPHIMPMELLCQMWIFWPHQHLNYISPAELLIGRCIGTPVPQSSQLLIPKHVICPQFQRGWGVGPFRWRGKRWDGHTRTYLKPLSGIIDNSSMLYLNGLTTNPAQKCSKTQSQT